MPAKKMISTCTAVAAIATVCCHSGTNEPGGRGRRGGGIGITAGRPVPAVAARTAGKLGIAAETAMAATATCGRGVIRAVGWVVGGCRGILAGLAISAIGAAGAVGTLCPLLALGSDDDVVVSKNWRGRRIRDRECGGEHPSYKAVRRSRRRDCEHFSALRALLKRLRSYIN
jgi:hypothetical protein